METHSLWDQWKRRKEEEKKPKSETTPVKKEVEQKAPESPAPKKNKKPIVLKVLVSGEGGVGKTTLIHKYVEGHFLEDTKMTIGVQFHTKYLTVDDHYVALQIWDFGGQEQFRFMLEAYTKGAKGGLLLFDMTRYFTLKNLEEWASILRTHDPELPILFLGTKIDLENQISVSDENAQEYKDQLNCFEFLKVSSKTGRNVEHAFQVLARKMIENIGL